MGALHSFEMRRFIPLMSAENKESHSRIRLNEHRRRFDKHYTHSHPETINSDCVYICVRIERKSHLFTGRKCCVFWPDRTAARAPRTGFKFLDRSAKNKSTQITLINKNCSNKTPSDTKTQTNFARSRFWLWRKNWNANSKQWAQRSADGQGGKRRQKRSRTCEWRRIRTPAWRWDKRQRYNRMCTATSRGANYITLLRRLHDDLSDSDSAPCAAIARDLARSSSSFFHLWRAERCKFIECQRAIESECRAAKYRIRFHSLSLSVRRTRRSADGLAFFKFNRNEIFE